MTPTEAEAMLARAAYAFRQELLTVTTMRCYRDYRRASATLRAAAAQHRIAQDRRTPQAN